MRIYKLYKDMIQNDMKKDKINAIGALKRVREENKYFISEYLEMQQENTSLKNAIKRYQGLVKNFDEEYENVQQFIEEQAEVESIEKKKE